MTVVVLGAGRGIGREITRQLVEAGREVRAVTRSGGVPEGAEDVRADLLDRDAAVRAVRGASVVHFAANVPYPDWASTLPTLVDNALSAAREAGAKFVFADNLYAYGPVFGPLVETLPERPLGPKEKLRRALGRTVRESGVPFVIVRSSDYFGPGGVGSLPGELLVKPLALGRSAMWFAPVDVPQTFAFLGDTARAQVVAGDSSAGDGRVWHVPAAPAVTVRSFVSLAASALGVKNSVRQLPAFVVTLTGLFDRRLRGAGELAHQRAQPWVVDHSAFLETFGPFSVTPHEEAVVRTAEWYRASR